jgi:hypothetical protein
MKRLVALFAFLLFALPALAAPTVADSVVVAASGGTTRETGSITVASGEMLAVFVGWSGSDPQPDVTAVKWGGSGGTTVTQQYMSPTAGSGTDFFKRVGFWLLTNPTAQTSTVHVTLAATAGDVGVIALAIAGGEPSSPYSNTLTHVSGTSIAATSLNVTSATGKLVVDFLARLSTNANATGAGQTEIIKSFTGTELTVGSSSKAGATTTNFTWEDGGAGSCCSHEWTTLGVSFNESGGGGGGGGGLLLRRRRN